MTTPRRDGGDSPFSAWIRNEPRLDSIKERLCVVDCDYWIHQYVPRQDRWSAQMLDQIMLVELKPFQSRLSYAQRDTMRLVSACIQQVFYKKDGRVRTLRVKDGAETRRVQCFGTFLLTLEHGRPDTGGWIAWHGRKVSLDELIEILSFKRDPRTLRARDNRRHHAPPPAQRFPEFEEAS